MNPCDSIAFNNVPVCIRFRLVFPSSTTTPSAIASSIEATTNRTPNRSTHRSRVTVTSSKSRPVSICRIGNGIFAGKNAFSANRNITIESLPPENINTGFSNSAATSRKIWIDSASS
ncbi:unannotated protein [freshwater metagenome]|uniref:Unannotated protein n=1 Tax=freshwater metagenome TaxID=449393 RepID=A0A6J6P7S4_9ZZZZ